MQLFTFTGGDYDFLLNKFLDKCNNWFINILDPISDETVRTNSTTVDFSILTLFSLEESQTR